jgi:hypothetical protein
VRWRSAIGSGVVLVAVVAAVVTLRAHPAPTTAVDADQTTTTAPPVKDARSAQLTSTFLHTTELQPTFRIEGDPGTRTGFTFARYTVTEPGLDPSEYVATGSLVKTTDDTALDHVSITVARVRPRDLRLDFGRCDPTGSHDGSSCTERSFPDGTTAKVVRNAAFAQSVASDATTGARIGTQTQLDAVFPNGTLLVVTVDANNGAGIPLDDAAMLRLATIRGVSAPA